MVDGGSQITICDTRQWPYIVLRSIQVYELCRLPNTRGFPPLHIARDPSAAVAPCARKAVEAAAAGGRARVHRTAEYRRHPHPPPSIGCMYAAADALRSYYCCCVCARANLLRFDERQVVRIQRICICVCARNGKVRRRGGSKVYIVYAVYSVGSARTYKRNFLHLPPPCCHSS